MRNFALLSAAFAGCALSSPLIKRDADVVVNTVYDTAYVTQIVTATATASAAPEVESAAPQVETVAAESTPAVKGYHREYNNYVSWAWTTSIVQAAPEPTSTQAPVLESTSAVYVAPSSVYVAPSSASAAPTSSAAETSAAPAQATNYQQRVVAHHNVHRANHSAPDLTWSDSLAATAQKIGESCVYAHDVTTDGGGYGQNIAAGVEASNVSAVITDLFYNGEVNYFADLYGQATPDMSNFHAWGHFSQIVWKSTTQVGCATVDCTAKGLQNVGQNVSPFFTVCNYKSAGNYGGEYAENVVSPLNKASVDWNYDL